MRNFMPDRISGGGAFGLVHAAAMGEQHRQQVLLVDVLLAISQSGEVLVDPIDFLTRQLVAKFAILENQRMPARVLAENDPFGRNANCLWRHDLVAQRVVQHAVLMDTRFVRESIAADDGLVGLDFEANQFRQQSGWCEKISAWLMPVSIW